MLSVDSCKKNVVVDGLDESMTAFAKWTLARIHFLMMFLQGKQPRTKAATVHRGVVDMQSSECSRFLPAVWRRPEMCPHQTTGCRLRTLHLGAEEDRIAKSITVGREPMGTYVCKLYRQHEV